MVKPDNRDERNIPGHFVQPHPWSSLFLPSQTPFLMRLSGHQLMSEYLYPPGKFYMNYQLTNKRTNISWKVASVFNINTPNHRH